MNGPLGTRIIHPGLRIVKSMMVILLVYHTGMNNLLSCCGSVDARISASEKDLTVKELRSYSWTRRVSEVYFPTCSCRFLNPGVKKGY